MLIDSQETKFGIHRISASGLTTGTWKMIVLLVCKPVWT